VTGSTDRPRGPAPEVASVADDMRAYWDARAQENAVWYVDTTMDPDAPDMERFFATGPAVVRSLLHEAPVQPTGRGRAVEIGSGLGRICLALADDFDEVVGVDISETMVAKARSLVDRPGVRFEVVTGADLSPIEDASADLVTTFTVFQHMPKASLINAYLHEAARVLRPGGVLAAQWNNLPHPRWGKARGRWERTRHRIGGPLRLDARVAPEFVGLRVPLADMEAMVRSSGLTVEGSAQVDTLFAWIWATKAGDAP
jgi:SAM-dependent methyltransferase